MTIAEKITRAKSDIDDSYNAGYAKGKAEGGDTQGAYEQGVADGIEQGKRAVWYAIQKGGAAQSYYHSFFETELDAPVWNDETFTPFFDFICTSCNGMFRGTGVTDLAALLERRGVVLNTSQSNDFSSMFAYSKYITRVGEIDTTASPSLTDTFSTGALVTIEKLKLKSDGTQSFTRTFGGAISLVHLAIEGVIGRDFDVRNSTNLSRASIESVMAALSTTTTGLTATFSRTAVNKAFATTTGGSNGSTSAEWLALVATRPNCTIALA